MTHHNPEPFIHIPIIRHTRLSINRTYIATKGQ
jgi:hypothetical protein